MRRLPAFGVALFVLLLPLVAADLGPKPTADLKVTYQGQPVNDPEFYAIMLSCLSDDRFGRSQIVEEVPHLNISEADPARQCAWRPHALAWGGVCTAQECSLHYSLPKEFKLAVYIPSM